MTIFELKTFEILILDTLSNLRKMKLYKEFDEKNPFLFWRKSKLCRKFININDKTDEVLFTKEKDNFELELIDDCWRIKKI